MKCEACAKREATVAYTHIVADAKKTIFLCPVCAAEKNIEPAAEPQAKAEDVPELVKEVKAELANLVETEEVGSISCSVCGMGYGEFKKAGRLGCPDCYGAFAPQLERLLKRIHGADKHQGKGPIAARPEPPAPAPQPQATDQLDQLDQLRDELAKAVSAEAFEEAAQLRDRILDLEGGQRQ